MSHYEFTFPESPAMEITEGVSSEKCTSWFSCRGNLSHRNVKRFLDSEFEISSEKITVLFGKSFPTQSALWNYSHLMFLEIKKNFYLIRAFVDNSNAFLSTDTFPDAESLRKDICQALAFLTNNLQMISFNLTNSIEESANSVHISKLLSSLVKEVKKLLLFVGRVSSIPNIMHNKDFADNSTHNSYYHYVHLYLDIWCNSLGILNEIISCPVRMEETEEFSNHVEQSDPFMQVATVLMTDLVAIAINNHKNMNSFSTYSPFMCSCFQDVWIMLINILDKRSSKDNDTFWSVYHSIVQHIQKHSSNSQTDQFEEMAIDNFTFLSFPIRLEEISKPVLWLTSYIAPLYKYDLCRNFCDSKTPKSCYGVVKCLINSLLTSNFEGKEKILCHALFYTVQLVSLWEPSCEILLPLTDFFIKRINENICLSENDIQGISFLHKNSASWYQYISNLTCSNTTLGKESSYDIFLRLLGIQLTKDLSKGYLWRSLKGRVFSKFMPRKMKELSEIGLQNSLSLFLAIAESGQVEVIDKICDFASVIETTASPKKQVISWKALFVLILMHQKKKINMNKIITKLTTLFHSTCFEYSRITGDSIHKTNIMNLLLVYIDSMSEIFEKCCHSNFPEYQLIGSGFSVLLKSCSITELNYILGVFLNILVKVQILVSESSDTENTIAEMQYIELLDLIFNHVYPFVKHMSTTNTPPPLIADIAAILTSLFHKFISSLPNQKSLEFYNIFLHFGSQDSVNSLIMCRYLCFILDDEPLLNGLKEKLPDFDSVMFQSWLKCIIFIIPPNDQMNELSKKVLLLNKVVEHFPDVKNLNFRTDDHVFVAISFFRVMGQTYNISDLHHKNKLKLKVNSWFKVFVTSVVNRIQKHCDNQTLSYVYKLSSHLVMHCSQLLHIKFNTASILPHIFDKTVIPHIVYPKDKHSQAILSCSIKEYLPNFIKGLFLLDFKKDKCIERQIKDIVGNYICLYSPSNNPISKLLVDSANSKPEGLKQEALEFFLEIIKINLIFNRSANSTNAFEMLYEVLRLSPLLLKKAVADALLKSALEIFMKQEDTLSNYLRSLIKKIFIYFRDKMNINSSKNIIKPIIEWFVQEQLQWSPSKGFSVLDCVIEHLPQVLFDLVSFLTKTIEELEKNRGFGTDVLLRNHLRNTITKLQHKLSRDTALSAKN